MNLRRALLEAVAERLLATPSPFVLRVAIDGVDGAGKTTFADELAPLLAPSRAVIRASVDGFHHPREVRYRRGRTSPEGFYRDSYNYGALKRFLLDPLSPGGSGYYRTAVYDVEAERPVEVPEKLAAPGSVLLLDGIFLHRPELRDAWDVSVWLEVPFEVSVPRGAARGPGFGSPDPHAESNRRYIEGQRLYMSEAEPRRHATMVVNNEDVNAPYVVAR
ncbi:uridine kinase [Truepera radiovictrix]|uniref:Phosphoribulokinase / uridine kinase family n=1 Tax=Truepera radiovictrix (strain DSM 17093 / CIP 108686 / LMG 22925 / RQ-24) TaxID=649638 RepID=D7CXA6_TRURR|nr:uridine kinase [Truepera radiovictrix]ADI13230.1 phosphoribulokinase / uridine kinase family [Truepera radiovictrix DSM 17093]WMT58206.1 uridine kinase [Truepera radiovictrix]